MNKKLFLYLFFLSNLFGDLINHEKVESASYGIPVPIKAFIDVTVTDFHRFSLLYRPYGNIEYIGRTDFQVKIRGFRIELGEIENTLITHPLLSHAVVIDRENNDSKYYPDNMHAISIDKLPEKIKLWKKINFLMGNGTKKNLRTPRWVLEGKK